MQQCGPERQQGDKLSLKNEMLPWFVIKSYRGERLVDGTCAVIVEMNTFLRNQPEPLSTTSQQLPLCLHVRNHSPTGFAWGYTGSGPAQLALALLVDALGDADTAQSYYQEFKRQVIAGLPDSWSLTAEEIRRFVAQKRKKEGAAGALTE